MSLPIFQRKQLRPERWSHCPESLSCASGEEAQEAGSPAQGCMRLGFVPWMMVWLSGGGQAGGMSTVVWSGFLAVLAELAWVLLGLVTIRLFSGVLGGPGLDGFPGLLAVRRLTAF